MKAFRVRCAKELRRDSRSQCRDCAQKPGSIGSRESDSDLAKQLRVRCAQMSRGCTALWLSPLCLLLERHLTGTFWGGVLSSRHVAGRWRARCMASSVPLVLHATTITRYRNRNIHGVLPA